MDAATLTEISIVGDPSAGEAELTRIALRKLKYVLEKEGQARRNRLRRR